VQIQYNRTDRAGLEPDSPAQELAATLARRPEDVTFLSGHRDSERNYDSDIFQVRGADTNDLLEAAIVTYRFIGPRRTDIISGRSVIRATPEPSGAFDETPDFDAAPYFYAFDDVVVIILGRRDLVEEAFAALP
jgi:hypothetical protein